MEGIESRNKRTLLIIGVIMAATELVKQLLLTFVAGRGSYQWWYFPWQLCSIPMYVCIIAGLCQNSKIYHACLAFLSDFGLLAGICAFLDTSGFYYELGVLTAHSYVWHIVLIILGIYSWYVRAKLCESKVCNPKPCNPKQCNSMTCDPISCNPKPCNPEQCNSMMCDPTSCNPKPCNPKQNESKSYGSKRYESKSSFLGGLLIYLSACAVAEIINVIAFDNGCRPINMFYISPRYMMGQVYIRDVVPSIGNNAGIVLYIFVTIVGALIIDIIGNAVRRIYTSSHSAHSR